MDSMLNFSGHANFRNKVACSLLSGRSFVSSEIRTNERPCGLKSCEIDFLRLVEKLTDGTEIKISRGNTKVEFRPGTITNGSGLEHFCGERAVGYYLEGILVFVLFGKRDLKLTLHGATNSSEDISVDHIKNNLLKLFGHFGVESFDIKVVTRGLGPLCDGKVEVSCKREKTLRPISLVDNGLITRVSGVAYSTGVPQSAVNRIVYTAKGIFNEYSHNVWIFVDCSKNKTRDDIKIANGYGLHLTAETSTKCYLSHDAVYDGEISPESLAQSVSYTLLKKIGQHYCVDALSQPVFLLTMVLTPEDVSKAKFGQLSESAVECLRDFRDFFGVLFKLDETEHVGCVVVSCRGIGFSNLQRKMTI